MLKRTIAALLTAATVVAGGLSVRSASADTAPRTVLRPCTDLPALPTALCGTITVPLDRSDPAAGTTPVGFTLVPRTDRTRPALGTVTANPGGPGPSTIDLAGAEFAERLGPVLDRRDLLLVDPRGVGRSGPLRCAALDDPAPYFGSVHAQRAAIAECGRELGDKARYYHSAAVADDIDDVRAALGIPQLHLLGVSYGTFLMATYAQRHPTRVQSVVLSGAYPVNGDSSEAVAATALRRAVRLVCERTGKCDGAVVLRDLTALATRLRVHPVQLPVAYDGTTYPVVLDEWQLAGAVGKLYATVADTGAQLGLARAAAAAHRGDLAPIRQLVSDHLIDQAETAALGPELVSQAMSWAVTCHDYSRAFDLTDSPAERSRDYARHVRRLNPREFRPFSPAAWVTRDALDTGACLGWPADPTARPPFRPGAALPRVPVLVLSGDLDANTASRSGRQAAAQFPGATFVELENLGHTPVQSPAGLRLALDFFSQAR
jgi:pimeloyl-ACP methyl ester carboxylesterase